MRAADAYRARVEDYLAALSFSPDLAQLTDAVRYALAGGGKRIRPTLTLAVGEAAGARGDTALPAASAVELVHTFSLVHDDLPALDDDDVRRGRPSVHVQFGEAVAILAGDALLAEAFRLAASYETAEVARELTSATLAMIGGQHLDVAGAPADLESLHRLKTGALFGAAVGCALWVARVPWDEQPPWREFADAFGLLFQVADDIADGDGYVDELGVEQARALAQELATRATAALRRIPADTAVLAELVDGLGAATAAR